MHKCIVFGILIACMPEELTMKKDVAASAAEAVAPKKPEFSLIDENLLKSRIYTIRGVKVMLDADLAEIYGYETRFFNRQVKNNIEKFDEDFRFQLKKEEYYEILRCKFCTLGSDEVSDPLLILRSEKPTLEHGKYAKYLPYAFTEQGIYMLMTVLKGEQATAQSKALIRLFKQMKDYIAAENAPDISAGMVALATQTSQNTRDIAHCSRICCKICPIAVFSEISTNMYKTSSNSWHFLEKDCQIRGKMRFYFYYFSNYEQTASYRASLRHGATGLGPLHFAVPSVHGQEQLRNHPVHHRNHLHQQRRAQADARGDSAEADGAGPRTDCAVLLQAQEGMRVQAGDRHGRSPLGSFTDYRFVRKTHTKSRPDDAHESQTGSATF